MSRPVVKFKRFDCGKCLTTYKSPFPLDPMDVLHPCSNGRLMPFRPIEEIEESAACNAEPEQIASSDTPNKGEDDSMGTKRAAPMTEKVTKAPKVKAAAVSSEKRGRRSFGGRGWLASEIDGLLRSEPDRQWTVTQITAAVVNDSGEHPSSGAVAACIKRWNEQGYIKVTNGRPMAFNGFMAKWRDSSLDDFLSAQKTKRTKARAAARAE